MSPRYSMIPGDVVGVLKGIDLEVLVVLGRQTDKKGWCEANQRLIGERLGYARETINRSIKKLVDLGFVEKYDCRNAKKPICYYRVILDRPGSPEDDDDADKLLTSGGELSITTSHPPCDPGVTRGGACDPTLTRLVIATDHNTTYLSSTKEKEAPAGASTSHPPDPGPTSGAHYDARRDLALKLIAPMAAEAALQGGWLGKLFDFIVKHGRLPDIHEFEAVKREAAQFQQNLQSMPPRIASSVAIRARNILRDITEAQQPRSRAA